MGNAKRLGFVIIFKSIYLTYPIIVECGNFNYAPGPHNSLSLVLYAVQQVTLNGHDVTSLCKISSNKIMKILDATSGSTTYLHGETEGILKNI